MGNNGTRFYEFGEFKLDARRRILTKNGVPVRLKNRHLELLFVLVENEGRVLTHEELFDKVWDGALVEQSNLKKGISALRQVLEETPADAAFIRTVPRQGYSFVAPVRAFADVPESNAYIRQTEAEIEIEEIIAEDETANSPVAAEVFPVAPTKSFPLAPPRNRAALVFSSFFIFALLGVGVWLFYPKADFARFSAETARIQRLTSDGSLGNSVSVSPDGNFLVYPTYGNGQGILWLKQISTGSTARLTPPENVGFWAYDFAPDGNYVYYILNHNSEPSKSGLYKIPSLGGTAERILERANGGLTFAPDGNRLAFSRRIENSALTEVIAANLDGGNLNRVFVVPENRTLLSLKWSPDGKNLLCAFRERGGERNFSYVAEVDSSGSQENLIEKIVVPRQPEPIIGAVWMPDRKSLILNIREPHADVCQIWQFVPATNEKWRVTNDDNSYRFASLTRDGKTIFSAQESKLKSVWVAENESLDFRPVGGVANLDRAFWTSDGKLIYLSDEDKQETVWTINADGSDKRKITSGGDGIYLSLNVSPNDQITFVSSRTGTRQAWRIGAEGKNAAQLTNDLKTAVAESRLAADGKTLYFLGSADARGWLLYRQKENEAPISLTETDTSEWDLSPDEKLLVVRRADEKTKKYRIFVQNMETGEILKEFDFDFERQIRWTPDGKAIAYDRAVNDSSEIVIQPLDGGKERILTSLRGERISWFDWSADGKKLVVVRSRQLNDAVKIKSDTGKS